jgi:hypothetical protein
MTTMQTNDGTMLVPTAREALRQATLHALQESLRWAVDEIPIDPAAELGEALATAIRASDRAAALLDQLGWKPRDESVQVHESDEYLCALCVLALAYHHHERAFLHHEVADTLDALTVGWPTLDEDEAWQIVFVGESS